MINLVEISIEDAEQIFFAISVAEGEVGDEFKNLKAKLYKIFPEILVAHTEGERRRKAEMDNQTSKRREITEAFLKTVELGKPLLGQVVTWYLHTWCSSETKI